MITFDKDHYALGLHPNGIDILLQLLDLELGFSESPISVYILGFLLDGYSQREIAKIINVHHKTIQNRVKDMHSVLQNCLEY